MAIVSSGALIDAVRRYGLVPPGQLARLPELMPGRLSEAHALARILLQRGWLTIFQVTQLLAGKGQELILGPYVILDRLGQGGLSQVFKARHPEHGWVVALKVLRPEVLTSAEGRQEFLQEVDAMARLDHPNIVGFCDADLAGDTCFFAMEYVEGTDLARLVRLMGWLPVSQACDYACQAALGLEHAHEHNLVHRDIKPANLFLIGGTRSCRLAPCRAAADNTPAVNDCGLVKILDWGLAALRLPGKAPPAATAATGVIGTADYLSPEQAKNAHAVDIRADIYSLGCTLYYLLTGQPPFPDGKLMEKLMRHQREEPRAVASFRGDVPNGVTSILKRMMAKNPAERYRTPAAAALDLLPYTEEERVETALREDQLARPARPASGVQTPLPMPLEKIRRESACRRHEQSLTADESR